MKINTDIDIFPAQQETASGYKQHFGGFIDAILAIILFFVLSYVIPAFILVHLQKPMLPEILILLVFAFYRLTSLLIFNSTIGMRLTQIKLLNGELKPLSAGEKVCAAFFVLINGVDYYDRKG
ncbi:MAG TPA: hypothetical protein VFQ73_01700 [Flavisolibacter sp.]|nr:hypothetical protein [Flavisolibacter sp.]